MKMDYNNILTNDQKREILQTRILSFASEAYQVDLSIKSLGENDERAPFQKNILNDLIRAIEVHQKELDSLTN